MKNPLWFVGSILLVAALALASCAGAGAAPAAPAPSPTPCARTSIEVFGAEIGALKRQGADCPPTPAPTATIAPTSTPMPTSTPAPTQPTIVQNITITGNSCSNIQIAALGNSQTGEVHCSTVSGTVPTAVAIKAPPPRPTAVSTATPECTSTPVPCNCEQDPARGG